MICISQISLKNPKDGKYIAVPCGKCGACRSNRRADWTFRLHQEHKSAFSAFFITLTYEDGNLPHYDDEPTVIKKDVQDFMKRLRKENSKWSDISPRYYAVGEYGTETERPHYHILLFNVQLETMDKLEKLWTFGNVKLGVVTDARIHYTTKYHVNVDKEKSKGKNREPEFALMSTKPPIGQQYLLSNYSLHKDNLQFTVNNNGFSQRLPRYYKDKIFTDFERKAQAISQGLQIEKKRLRDIEYYKRLRIIDPQKYIWDREIRLSQQVKTKTNDKSKPQI